MVAAANLVEVAGAWVTLRERRCLTPLWAASRCQKPRGNQLAQVGRLAVEGETLAQ